MSRFTLTQTPIDGVLSVERQYLDDERGFLSRLFCREALPWPWPIAQINHSHSSACGTLRGMHYQLPPHAEAKLVTCLRGEIFDVALDLRAESPTFLQWHGVALSAENGRALLIPPGCAHGFQALSSEVELLYLHSTPYTPELERRLNPLDPRLAIQWPLAPGPMSPRDAQHPMLDENTCVGIHL